VNKPDSLPSLNAAVSGARYVEQWLRSEGFSVELLVDEREPVRAFAVQSAIERLVRLGTLQQLVIYFAGHGFLNAGRSEVWMLSGAPANSSEAVNVEASVYDAREAGIPNVVFISDACRSTPESLQSSKVQGYVVFPNLPVAAAAPRPDVDRFFAALPGRESNEVVVSESTRQWEGIYTSVLLDAFRNPDIEMVRTINGVKVVPNRMLKDYLSREVPRRAQAKSIRLNQVPESIVESPESFYMGRVENAPPSSATISAARPLPPTIRNVARVELNKVGSNVLGSGSSVESDAAELGRIESDFMQSRMQVEEGRGPESFETGSGINVIGTELENVVCNVRMRVERLSATEFGYDVTGMGQILRVYPGAQPGGSVALHFRGGGGTVVAALRDFVATVIVEQGRVINVSYVPTMSSKRWYDYDPESERLEQLRAVVAAAARFGVFRIEGDRETRTRKAAELAGQIRVSKGLDPTLGVYAAYAYSDADIVDQVRSVREYMRGDLGIDLFDVAMLAGSLSDISSPKRTVPFCPMLSQGWNLLRVKNAKVAPAVLRVRPNIRAALWTTFDTEGIGILSQALSAGRVL
jgi:hypothetical protein